MRCRPTVRLLGRPFAEEWGSAEGLPERIESMEHRRRVGLLVPSSDTVMEADLWRRLPSQFTLHVARMYMEST